MRLFKTERNEGRLEGMAVGKLKGRLEVTLENLGSLPSELGQHTMRQFVNGDMPNDNILSLT